MSDTVQSLQRQLAELEENLRLIRERKAEYVLTTEIPLQLIKDERRLKNQIVELRERLTEPVQAYQEPGRRDMPGLGRMTWEQEDHRVPVIETEITDLLGIDRQLADTRAQDIPRISLSGSRTVRVGISQMFRLADLLTCPESVRARKLYEAITDRDKLRRVLNRRTTFSLGAIGNLKPVVGTTERYNLFWRTGVPDLRKPTNQSLCFVPFELTLSRSLQQLQCDLESCLPGLSEYLQDIQNTQISGRLRIYPPGTGVIQLGITLHFREVIHIEAVARIAQNIEYVYFVDPEHMDKKPCNDLLLEVIDQVIDQLFTEEGFPYSERRWLPPETTLSFRDDYGLAPEKSVNELAYLMALAPGNREDLAHLRMRVQRALRSPYWRRDQVLAIAGQGVALLFVGRSFAGGRKREHKQLQDWLIETHELLFAAAYAQMAFAEEIEKISEQRLLDESWLPERGENFDYLVGLLSTMRKVARAMLCIKLHLRKQKTGILKAFAGELWTCANPGEAGALKEGLAYIADWLKVTQAKKDDERIEDLLQIIRDIQAIPLPFSP